MRQHCAQTRSQSAPHCYSPPSLWDWRPDVRWLRNAPAGRAPQSAGSNKLREVLVVGRRDGDVAGLAKRRRDADDAETRLRRLTKRRERRRRVVNTNEERPTPRTRVTVTSASSNKTMAVQ